MNKIKEFFEDILDSLRNTAYLHSEERREFAILRLKGHRDHMAGLTRFNPYTDFDEWDKHN
jgi:hypothetical protein